VTRPTAGSYEKGPPERKHGTFSGSKERIFEEWRWKLCREGKKGEESLKSKRWTVKKGIAATIEGGGAYL